MMSSEPSPRHTDAVVGGATENGTTTHEDDDSQPTRFSFYNADDCQPTTSPTAPVSPSALSHPQQASSQPSQPQRASSQRTQRQRSPVTTTATGVAISSPSSAPQRFHFYDAHEINRTHTVVQTVQALQTTSSLEDVLNDDDDDDDTDGYDDGTGNNGGGQHGAERRRHNHSNLDSSDILKSLQEHEQQRLEILSGPKAAVAAATTGEVAVNRTKAVSASGDTIARAKAASADAKLAAAEAKARMATAVNPVVAARPSTTPQPQPTQAPRPRNHHHHSNSRSHDNDDDSNPYEDAIKEALQLLRKHRSPHTVPPTHHRTTTTATTNNNHNHSSSSVLGSDSVSHETTTGIGTDGSGSVGGIVSAAEHALSTEVTSNDDDDEWRRQSAARSREAAGESSSATTPPAAGADVGEAYQAEMESRRKQRQERMARYASRLAELKQDGSDDGRVAGVLTAAGSGGGGGGVTIDTSMDVEDPHVEDHGVDDTMAASQDEPRRRRHSPSNPPPGTRGLVPPPAWGDEGIGPEEASSPVATAAETAATLSPGDAESSVVSNPRQDETDIQKGVERVLLAILERANSRGRTVLDDSLYSLEQQVASPSSQSREAVRPSGSGSVGAAGRSTASTNGSAMGGGGDGHGGEEKKSEGHPADALLKVMSDLLGPTSQDLEDAHESSGVEEIMDGLEGDPSTSLATQEDIVGLEETMVTPVISTELAGDTRYEFHLQHHQTDDAAPARENAMGMETDSGDQRNETLSSLQARDEADRVVAAAALPNSPRHMDGTRKIRSIDRSEDSVSVEVSDDSSYEDDGDDDDDDVDSADEDDDDETGSYEDETSDGDESEDVKARYKGALGPLSKRSGGTTGVVLDHDESSSSRVVEKSRASQSATSPTILESLSAAVSLVTGTAAQKSPDLAKHGRYDIAVSEDEESSSVDSEAYDLMQSLCAHMMPAGIERSQRLLEQRPHWDEENPDEAGYRIIRLTESQLRRVEREYTKLSKSLKKKAKRTSSPQSHASDDSAFERDLRAAEDLLEEEEKKSKRAQKKQTALATTHQGKDKHESSLASEEDDCLEAFPGVKSAGRGEMGELEYFTLPVIYKSHVTGFEPTKDMVLESGNVVAGQYLVEGVLGSAAFSTAYKCIDLSSDEDSNGCQEEVCLKVIKNTKDFFDQSLDEIKILELLRQTGQCHENYILEMKTFFYHREHLIIVTELLRQNLFEFGKFIIESEEEPYFTMTRLSYITRQCLVALNFVHQLGLVHSDIKPENILLASYSRAQAKVIDFGSSCYLTDRQSSYIQSRSYRAPEVVLGLPYDGRIDIWSLGCVVAEMFTGEVTFQNDSIVSMLSRIEAICGAFPPHMIKQGRQSARTFTNCGLLYEKVSCRKGDDRDESFTDESSNEDEQAVKQFDIFQAKRTTLAERLGASPKLMSKFDSGKSLSKEDKRRALFIDLVRKLLTIDPLLRPTAAEALEHPLMVYAATLTEEDVKYPSR